MLYIFWIVFLIVSIVYLIYTFNTEPNYAMLDKTLSKYKEGEMIKVKLVEVDKKTGKYRLSRKVLLPKPEGVSEGQGDSGRPPRRQPQS